MVEISIDLMSRRHAFLLLACLPSLGVAYGCGEGDVIAPVADPKRKTKLEREREEEEQNAAKYKSRKSRKK